MCGRFTQAMSWAEVHAFSRGLDLVVPAADPAPTYNLAPTQPAWVLAAGADARGARAEAMRWGLVPGWAKDLKIGASMINARLETVAVKPAFRSAWKARRCLVPASGYYEWREENGVKQPYYIHDREAPLLMFAALWERWKSPAAEWVHSFAIVTCAALDPMKQLHERTPLMLPAPLLHDWLHGSVESAAAIALAVEPPPLAWHPVSRAVGNPRSNGPQLVAPL
jgi:putative SOS response-associated peptidase YedK